MRANLPVFIFTVLGCLFLSSCESTSSAGIASRPTAKLAKPGEGYVMFSFTFAGIIEAPADENVRERFNGYVFKIRPIGDFYTNYNVGLLSTSQGGYYRSFDVYQGMGFVFAEPLPEGDYE
ncbi:MAG: hypothetical protein F6K30_26580, partial [Cyanothece sp. SIO2G6]|nr:hypothetical protein [Cyanothece sp. SIO2G6]